MKRSTFILLAGIALLATPVLAAASVASPIVADENGKLRGTVEDGVASWKAIPFAAPPVGPLRWRAPQPAAGWSGVRDATAYSHDCMQKPFGGDAAPLGTEPAEDCLYANVWKPAAAKAKLPVIVWIYGGGFVNGGSSPPTYSGANMAKKGVMFVSFNYRVGRFGTFAFPQLTKQDPDHGLLGNYNFMDQIAALKWVQRNIAKFGGDPANVTIIGESAGGMSVHTLVTSTLASGLFQKAIVMSGGNAETEGTLAQTEQIYENFAKAHDISPDDPKALDKLRALSADQVTDGLNLEQMFRPQPGPRTFSGPFIDGKLVVDQKQAYASGKFSHVPMIIGATSADIGGPTGYMVAGAHDIAGTVSAAGVPTYEYRFSYVASSIGKPGADHASDIPFFFDTQAIKYGDKTTDRDRAMGEAISAYLVNFAKTGDPNGGSFPKWPRYARAEDSIMNFAEDGQAVPGKDPLNGKFPVTLAAAAVDLNGADLTAATAWLSLMDSSNWDQSWNAAGTLFKSQMSQAGWASASKPVREPLGAVASRTLKRVTKASSLPGVPDGEYELIEYQTSFAQKSDATETVVLTHEPTGWKVDGYFVR